MLNYYTCLIILIWFALVIICMLVRENDRLDEHERRTCYLTYLFIFLASLAEWVGVCIRGNADIPSILLRIVKCLDYMLTPLAGAVLISQMKLRNIWSRIMNGIIIFNVIFQIVSFFTGWMTTIDEFNNYEHGSLYIIYTIEYVVIVVIVVIQFLIYGKGFRKQNRTSLYLIMIFVLLGIFMQEGIGKDVRTAYVTMTFGAVLMFIHSSEFSQQKADEKIQRQKIQISTDALTGLLNRYAYSKALKKFSISMPDDFVIFSIDINGLKMVNDTLGHDAGDELICGAARCIENVFKNFGSCYRTGGDEFIVLAEMDEKNALFAVQNIEKLTKVWKGDSVKTLSLSVGYALLKDNKDLSCSELLKVADDEMYKSKDEYYRISGMKR